MDVIAKSPIAVSILEELPGEVVSSTMPWCFTESGFLDVWVDPHVRLPLLQVGVELRTLPR